MERLPERIEKLISGGEACADDVGMSGAKVLVYPDRVLKIAPYSKKNEQTVAVMRWLAGRLPVPEVICFEREGDTQYLLMSRIKGGMACGDYYMQRPYELVGLLAEALKMLWSVDTSGCPRRRTTDAELAEARYRVENGLVNTANAEPETFGEGGFGDPAELLSWLERNRPKEDPVLSHGDLCLPNVFIDGGRISGFIDLGDTGVGDRWRDIALCWRSLKKNAAGAYGGKVYPEVDPDALFDAVGVAPDREKLRYYLLLDELF